MNVNLEFESGGDFVPAEDVARVQLFQEGVPVMVSEGESPYNTISQRDGGVTLTANEEGVIIDITLGGEVVGTWAKTWDEMSADF